MRAPHCLFWFVSSFLGAGWLFAQSLGAPPLPSRPQTSAPNPPLPSEPRSRLEFFRELLIQSPAERQRSLADKPDWQRKMIEAKLQEYGTLNPIDRELRLRVLELAEYLRPLMRLAPSNRVALLAKVPADYRKLIEDRLQQWDLLPPDLQREVWDNETMQHYFTRLDASTPAEREAILRSVPQETRQQLEQRWANWRTLTPDQRQKMLDRFPQFFELTDKEQQKILQLVSDSDRQLTQRTLEALEKLPDDQRRQYLESLRKFANLTPGDRYRFLQNVERWKAMSPAERQNWRILATKLPPLPPGLDEPPLPPGLSDSKRTSSTPPSLPGRALVTNR